MRLCIFGVLSTLTLTLGAGAMAGCFLVNPIDHLQSGIPGADTDGGSVDAPSGEGEAGQPDGDGAVNVQDSATQPITSCKSLKQAAPDTPDGPQTIDPDGPGPIAPFTAFCDMTQDGGGWMLVTDPLASNETAAYTTAQRRTNARGGVELRVYMNSIGCTQTPRSRHRVYLANDVPWTQVRYRQKFAGNASCWHIFGGLQTSEPLPANLLPFDKFLDTIRNEVRMGGTAGDAFDGLTYRCDETNENFWLLAGPERSAEVILRRNDPSLPAGLTTGAECGTFGPGTTSTTWWEYSEIYVR